MKPNPTLDFICVMILIFVFGFCLCLIINKIIKKEMIKKLLKKLTLFNIFIGFSIISFIKRS